MNMALSQEYVGSACELKTRQNQFLSKGRIIEIAHSHIKIDNEREYLPILALDTEVKLSIFTQNSSLMLLMGKVYISTPQFIIIREPRPLTESEKRSYFRVNADLQCEIRPVSNESGEFFPEKVSLKNISLGGLLLGSSQYLVHGQVFIVTMELPKGWIEMSSVIRRFEGKEGLLYWYGCQFLEPNVRYQDMIWQYILMLQQEEIRMRKEKRG